jgi:hypothetical protein
MMWGSVGGLKKNYSILEYPLREIQVEKKWCSE